VESGVEVNSGEGACGFGMRYRSVVGFGRAEVVDDNDEKKRALDLIVPRYGAKPEAYPEALLEVMKVIRVEIESMTGKRSE
jgi:nitroimidazol reductase NimA-like FMN-containing flavoprotein (pyridoxamine 5'-phosphate oxidase superfamily)